jgi:hypothetical protein
MYKLEYNNKMKENSKNKSADLKLTKSHEIPYKNKKLREKFNNIKESSEKLKNYNIFEPSVNNDINKENKLDTKENQLIQNQIHLKKRKVKSGNINYRSYNLKLFNTNGKKKINNKYKTKNSYFFTTYNVRPFTNDRLMNKSRNKNINQLNVYKTFNKKNTKIYENESDDEESSNTYNENRKDTEYNLRKRVIINGRETSNYERFCYDTLNAKLLKKDEEKNKKKLNIRIKYNEEVFNRNNQILVPGEELKKQLSLSSDDNSRTLRTLITSLNNSKYIVNDYYNSKYKNIITKTKNEKILKKILNLNGQLNEFKYHILTGLIKPGKNIGKKIDNIENLLSNGHRKLVIKNILYEKLNNKQQETIDNTNNNNKTLNELISSFDEANNKKFFGFVERKFLGELKKMKKLNIKDSIMSGIFDQHENYYNWKQNVNKLEEEKIRKDRRNLSESTKKIKNLAEIIYNKKRNKLRF